MAGLRWAGMFLCAVWLGGIAAAGSFAQGAPDQQDRLAAEAEIHARHFRYIDLPDLRDIQAALRVLHGQAGNCPLDCTEPDCAGLVAAIGAADQMDMSLMQLADVLDHLHDLEVRHLASLQGEAVLAEDRFRGDAEILLYQRFLVDVAGHITSTVFVYEDIVSLLEAGQDGEALNFAYALNELAGDMASLSQGLTGRAGAPVSAFDQEMATLQSELGNVSNIAAGNGARLNALSIIARRMLALGQAEMARRQAEVDALEREAYRERREVDQALTRTHALAVEAALLRQLAAEARQTGNALAPCAATCRSSAPPAEVLNLFLADPERGGNPDRLDQAALETLRELIALNARILRAGWQPDCEPPVETNTSPDVQAAAALAPPGPDADVARSVCFGLSRVGAVQAFDPDFQARLAPQMTAFMSSCTAWHAQVQAWPQNAGNPAHAQTVCQAECTMMGDYDRYILAQSAVAIDHVARMDEADRARQRVSIDAELRSLAVSLRLARRAETAPDGWSDWPDAAALEASRAALLDRREVLDHPSVWARAQTGYWVLGEAPQMMQCRAVDAISRREDICRSACGTNTPPPASCVNPVAGWADRLGEALYPPAHPQRSEFEARLGDGRADLSPRPVVPRPVMPRPVEPLPLEPVPYPQALPVPVEPDDPQD